MLGSVFDPQAELLITEQCRPHWAQAGAIVFITFRTHDSIPREVLRRWDQEKQAWLHARGLTERRPWSEILPRLNEADRIAFYQHFDRCREDLLDNHLGACLLRDRANAQIVADSLLHFDGERYRLGDFVVMPNHVHLLCAFEQPETMRKQCTSWLHFTATKINRRLGLRGRFWQSEPFDHLVRSSEQYDYLRGYIRNNPMKAKLRAGEFLYRRYD